MKYLSTIFVVAWLILIVFIAMPSISAQLTFTPDEVADIKLSCFDIDSDFCSGITRCNITIFYPNMTIFVDDGVMTNNINYFNFTTPVLVERGEYNCIARCEDGTNNGFLSFTFLATDIPASEQGVVAIGILFSLIALSFLFMIIGFKFIQTEKLFPFALFFILVSLIAIVYVLHLGYIYNRDILVSTMTTSGYFKIYFGIMYSLIGISMIGLTLLIVKTLKEFRERKSIQNYGTEEK